MFLLTDTGGTNTRIALADESGLHSNSLKSFRNADFSSFDEVIETYLSDLTPQNLDACCFAFAGPVHGRAPRLTNLNWQIDSDRLEKRLGAPVVLMNDLEAMARAVSELSPDDQQPLTESSLAEDNGQMLAVGLGTGMNVCAIRNLPDGRTATWACEYGHSPMPGSICLEMLDFGLDLARYPSVEELFSGRGLARAREDGLPDSLFCTWFAQVCAALTTQFLPMGGIYLAGGVSRAILASAGTEVFEESFAGALYKNLNVPPISLITADSAALKGCLARLKAL